VAAFQRSLTQGAGSGEVKTLVNPAIADAFTRVLQTFQKHYHRPDLDAIRLVYAAALAHRLTGQPAWLMLVAVPGSMKTEIIKSLVGQEKVFSIDAVTPNTFLSGQFGNKEGDAPSSLLHRIGEQGIILIPDFSTVLSQRPETRSNIFADLRRIFDGELAKEFGHRKGSLKWTGRITCMVAATPAVQTYGSFEGALGERFLRVRIARPGVEAARMAMRQNPHAVKSAIQSVVTAFFSTVPAKPTVTMPRAIEDRLIDLANLLTIGRHFVPRDDQKRITSSHGAEDAESATRAGQQLAQLAKGLAVLRGDTRVTDADLGLCGFRKF
jgi:hypothetical protein